MDKKARKNKHVQEAKCKRHKTESAVVSTVDGSTFILEGKTLEFNEIAELKQALSTFKGVKVVLFVGFNEKAQPALIRWFWLMPDKHC